MQLPTKNIDLATGNFFTTPTSRQFTKLQIYIINLLV